MMIFGWLFLLLGGIIVWVIAKKRYKDEASAITKKDTSVRNFIAVGFWVLDLLPKGWGRQKTNYTILQLYGRQEYGKRIRLFYAERIAWVVLCIFLANIFAVLIVLNQQQIISVSSIERPAFVDGDIEGKFYYDVVINNQLDSDSIELAIPKLSPTDQELQLEFQRIVNELPDLIRGKNRSLLDVREPLILMEEIQQSGIQIKWESGNQTLLQNNGKTKCDSLNDEGQEVLLTATLSYDEKVLKTSYKVHLYRKQYTQEEEIELVRKELISLLSKENINLTNRSSIELPANLENHPVEIKWYLSKKQISPIIVVLMGVVCGIFLQLIKKKELELMVKKREDALRMAFPSWINKFTLLMNAGMTFSKAFEKIAEDYILVRDQSGKTNPLYEEMVISLEDIRKGVSELKAIESMGQRSKVPELLRFTSAVIQNIKKGGQLLLIVLQQQSKEALLMREDLARKKGEKASTRLIFPMAIMLLAIMLIVMTPAVLSLNI